MEYSNNNQFDYILAGGGMAALSLAYYLNNSALKSKSILIIDRDDKNTNDHTYCFWEKGNSIFEPIVSQKWNKLWFYGTNNFSELLDLDDLNYKMIRAIDFYEFVHSNLNKNPNIKILKAEINQISGKDGDIVQTSKGEFRANELVFDSVFRPKYNNPKFNNLLQHFKGWVIETEVPTFKINEPTLFDFRVEQKNECRFIYVLPYSETKALIEFTIFSDNLVKPKEYEYYLKNHIDKTLKISNYTLSETEFGIIPMSDEPHEVRPALKTIRIGTAGGYVKSSTGYSFQRTQIFLQKIVENLENGNPLPSNYNYWKNYLDSVLLNVMLNKRMPQNLLFTTLFQKNSASQVLKFLSEGTSLWQDFKIMNSVPKLPFIKSAIRVFYNHFT